MSDPERPDIKAARDDKRVYTTSEAAPLLGVLRAAVARWCDQGKLKALNVGGPHRPRYRVPAAEVRRLLGGTEQQQQPAIDVDDLARKVAKYVVVELRAMLVGLANDQ